MSEDTHCCAPLPGCLQIQLVVPRSLLEGPVFAPELGSESPLAFDRDIHAFPMPPSRLCGATVTPGALPLERRRDVCVCRDRGIC